MDATEIYSTFDNLFKTVERQSQRIARLETLLEDLQERLNAHEVLPFPAGGEEEDAAFLASCGPATHDIFDDVAEFPV